MSSEPFLISVPDAQVRRLLGDIPAGAEVVEWNLVDPPPRRALDIVVPPYLGVSEALAHLEGVPVRLVQSLSIGYDGVERSLPPGHVFANAAGVHETSTAELTVALILASQRGIPDFVRDAASGTWKTRFLPSLADRTVLLVGYGGVGRAIESRLKPFEVTMVRVASSPRRDDNGEIFGVDSLSELLPHADVVVVAVPLNDATHHLVNDAFLGAMPDHALLVNVARGQVADTAALVDHASRRGLRLALDVTDPEPLPSDHALFRLSNVLITPHVGGASTAMLPRVSELLQRQISRMMNGEEPLNVVLRT